MEKKTLSYRFGLSSRFEGWIFVSEVDNAESMMREICALATLKWCTKHNIIKLSSEEMKSYSQLNLNLISNIVTEIALAWQ